MNGHESGYCKNWKKAKVNTKYMKKYHCSK